MKIVVLIKQVPETKAVRIDEQSGTVVRTGADVIVNPLDLHAVEAAIQLKAKLMNGEGEEKKSPSNLVETIALTMGPISAKAVLQEALAMGIDRAILVSDPAFAGSDTLATSFILAETIQKEVPDVDLILCGRQTTDGDTGQVGPEVAAALDMPVITDVSHFEYCENDTLQVAHLVEGGTEIVSVELPVVLTVNRAVANPQLPALLGKMRSRREAIKVYSQSELHLPEECIGRNGSPTSIVRLFRPQWTRKTVVHRVTDESSLAIAVEALVSFLAEREV